VFNVNIALGSLTPGLASVGLAMLLLVFTVITFLTHRTARHWPAFVGLILSIAIAVAAFKRAKGEGVEMPTMPKTSGSLGAGMSTGGDTSSSSSSGSSGESSAGPDPASEDP